MSTKKPKFRVGQVVAFKVMSRTHYERIKHIGTIKGTRMALTENGYVSTVFNFRPLTAKERGK